MPATRKFINASIFFSGTDRPVPVITPSGSRVNVTTAGAGSTAEAALPTGSYMLRIAATEPCFLRFGNTGIGAAAADPNSMYFPAGAEYFGVPLHTDETPFTHVRVIRVGANDTTVQFERIA